MAKGKNVKLRCLTHELTIFGKGIKIHEYLGCVIRFLGIPPEEEYTKGRSKLTWIDVEAIRRNYKFRSNLYKHYKVHPATILNIVQGKTWKKNPGERKIISNTYQILKSTTKS